MILVLATLPLFQTEQCPEDIHTSLENSSPLTANICRTGKHGPHYICFGPDSEGKAALDSLLIHDLSLYSTDSALWTLRSILISLVSLATLQSTCFRCLSMAHCLLLKIGPEYIHAALLGECGHHHVRKITSCCRVSFYPKWQLHTRRLHSRNFTLWVS